MRVISLILTLLLSAFSAVSFVHADDHVETAIDGVPVQPEDVLVEEESIEIPLKHKRFNGESGLPPRGMHKNTVKKEYGEPQKQVGPTGKPPISRWMYADFTVYFESGWVIHTVRTP